MPLDDVQKLQMLAQMKANEQAKADREQAYHWFTNRTGLGQMMLNGEQIEDMLVAYAQYANGELIARFNQVVQERVAEELRQKVSRIPATFKKDSRKFKPEEDLTAV